MKFRCPDPSDAFQNFLTIPAHLYSGKHHKCHETSQVWAFNSAGHPFSGKCQMLHFCSKDTPVPGRLIAVFPPRAFVGKFSTQAI